MGCCLSKSKLIPNAVSISEPNISVKLTHVRIKELNDAYQVPLASPKKDSYPTSSTRNRRGSFVSSIDIVRTTSLKVVI